MNPSPPDDSAAPQAEDRSLRIVLLTARRAEYLPALEQAEGTFKQKLIQNHPYYARDTEQARVRVTHLGVGNKQAKHTLGNISSILEGDLLILAGTAGSLHEDLGAGDLFIPTALAHTSDKDWHYPDTELLHWLVGCLTPEQDEVEDGRDQAKLRMGPMVTSPRPVIEPEQRQYLQEKTKAMAVDMESSLAIEKFSQSEQEEGQWLGIRIISDTGESPTHDEIEAKQARACEQLHEVLGQLLNEL